MADGSPRTRAKLAGALLFLAAVPASLGEDVATISDVIARLDSAQLFNREVASLELLERVGELSEAIGDEVDPATLTPEQRDRVVAALRQRFMLTPRAGLGAGIGEPPPVGNLTSGALIVSTVAGFPAARMLRANDTILEAQGSSLVGLARGRADFTLRCTILSLDPGDPIRLTIERDGEVLELEVPTKSFAELNNVNARQPDQRYLDGAWRLRVERMGLGDGTVEQLPLIEQERWTAHYKKRDDVPGMAPGGRPRGVRDAERSVPALARLDPKLRNITKMRLADEALVRQLNEFITNARRELSERRLALREETPGTKGAQRVLDDIQRLENQLRGAERRYKQIRSRLGDAGLLHD